MCYYILSGLVEVKYVINNDVFGVYMVVKVNDCEINYIYVVGEYFGFVLGDGREFDYLLLDNIWIMEVIEFLWVYCECFYSVIKRV